VCYEEAEAQQDGRTRLSASLYLTTSVQTTLKLQLQAGLMYPTVLPSNRLAFPRTQIRTPRPASAMVPVRNPSIHPVHVQLVLPPEFEGSGSSASPPSSQEPPSFLLSPQGSQATILEPFAEALLGPILFAPASVGFHKFTFFIKNNLTILDAVHVTGEGGNSELALRPHDAAATPIPAGGEVALHVTAPADLDINEPSPTSVSWTLTNTGDMLVEVLIPSF
jgi:hypothetical protein